MNNYRNYGNYGNRRYAGGMDDCGCAGNNSARMMQNRSSMKAEADCDCMKKEDKKDTDCGCMGKEDKKETDCGCMGKEDKKEKDCGCHEEQCGCSVESMYREMKKDGICCETDMPGKALAMAYVPWQSWRKLYEVCEGFSTGTIFKELDFEFYGRRCN